MPTVKAGNRICQPNTQANCRRDSRTGSRSIVDLLSPTATRRTNAPHPCAQGYSDAATKASPRIRNSSLQRYDHLPCGSCTTQLRGKSPPPLTIALGFFFVLIAPVRSQVLEQPHHARRQDITGRGENAG